MSSIPSPLVSLIIPTYRREESLCACLTSALAQDYLALEILVIDQTDQHSPATESFFASLPSSVRLIRHQPPGAVGARNRGLADAYGELLIFIDDDTTFDSGFVSAHAQEIADGADVVQGRVIEPGRGVSYRPQWMLPWLRVIGSNTYDQPGVTNTLTGCNFSITRRAQQQVGLFDTKFAGIVIREDADFGARCHRAGLQMRFSAAAVLTHHRDPVGGVDVGVRELRRELEPDVLRNELYFAHKHYPRPIVWQYRLRLARRLRRLAQEAQQPLPDIPALLARADRDARALCSRPPL